MQGNFPVWLWSLIEQARIGGTSSMVKDGSPDEDEEKQQYVNYYRCPFDGTEWVDIWSCCCNDMCPKCGTKDIEPYKSEEVVHTKRVTPTPRTKRRKKTKRSR
jgi:hypothetical protein